MNFYQQKYFKPYRKIASELKPQQSSPPYNDSFNNSHELYESPQKGHRYTRAPAFERTPSKNVIHTRTYPEPIWQHLYKQGVKSQKQLIQKHANNKQRLDIECTFQPMLKQNKRYMIHSSSNFLDRVNMWNEQKIQKMVKQKQQEVNKDLKQCTFTPKINQQRSRVEKRQLGLRHQKSQNQLKQRNKNINPYYSPIKTATSKQNVSPIKNKPPANHIEMATARQLIKNQLRKLAL